MAALWRQCGWTAFFGRDTDHAAERRSFGAGLGLSHRRAPAGRSQGCELRGHADPIFGVPCNPPPWGTLAAVDLAAGTIRWRVPLGSMAFGLVRGLPNVGGPIVTASGLVFIAAASDDKLRAFDVRTGRELWQASLPAGGQATPMTYVAGGRQFVVIAAGGHAKMGSKFGDAVVAFALPAAGAGS
jgi:quinoprotein glucose dehydrogenase